MTDGLVSLVLPVHNQADHIGDVVREYRDPLERLRRPYEVVLVPNGSTDATPDVCRQLAAEYPFVRVVPSEPGGWGRAVRVGIREARGELICYTNSARTAPHDLALMLVYATAYPEVIVKANRKIRERWTRRIGSLLYNIQCRTLFDLSNWDVNGTPKVFPRRFEHLLALTRDDDLIDVEFCLVCRRHDYPLVEVPVFSYRRHGGRSTTTMKSAMGMYFGALRLWREQR